MFFIIELFLSKKIRITFIVALIKFFKHLKKKYIVEIRLLNLISPIWNKFWKKSSFKKIKHYNFDENIDLHLKSYTWIAKIFAQKMKFKKISGEKNDEILILK